VIVLERIGTEITEEVALPLAAEAVVVGVVLEP
jgi:hypothetical protein